MPKRWLVSLHVAGSATLLFIAIAFFFFPAAIALRVVLDPEVRHSGQSTLVPSWFADATIRYDRWARAYLKSQRAAQVNTDDVAATEWPLFGSVFFMLAADELTRSGRVRRDARLDATLAVAAEVIADPASGTWVKRKWGDDYLRRENVFYRMLLILGLSTYERITGARQYHELASGQARSLSDELLRAPHHLADDYPGECYPNDIVWAAVAIQRAANLEGRSAHDLVAMVLGTLDGAVKTRLGLPGFQVDALAATIDQEARGCGNSGLLSLAGELDPAIAARWYAAHVEHFWSGQGWAWGFRELPHGNHATLVDVDSGPVLFGLGSVASVFGIGAARSAGRIDHAAPLIMETVAASWPTPFGFVVPGIFGWLAADGGCFGELAILFSMTRPSIVPKPIPYTGAAPPIVWLFIVAYALIGFAIVVREALWWRHRRASK